MKPIYYVIGGTTKILSFAMFVSMSAHGSSVVSQPEAVVAGIAAAIFPATGESWQPATIDESDQFLSAYIRASTRAWTPEDTEAFWAASVWTLAVDAKEAVASGSRPTLTEAEALERLSLAGA